jgi:hypothetical protein
VSLASGLRSTAFTTLNTALFAPNLCRALDTRRPEYRQRRLGQIETILRQACHERPAPRLKELAKRCGFQSELTECSSVECIMQPRSALLGPQRL